MDRRYCFPTALPQHLWHRVFITAVSAIPMSREGALTRTSIRSFHSIWTDAIVLLSSHLGLRPRSPCRPCCWSFHWLPMCIVRSGPARSVSFPTAPAERFLKGKKYVVALPRLVVMSADSVSTAKCTNVRRSNSKIASRESPSCLNCRHASSNLRPISEFFSSSVASVCEDSRQSTLFGRRERDGVQGRAGSKNSGVGMTESTLIRTIVCAPTPISTPCWRGCARIWCTCTTWSTRRCWSGRPAWTRW